jgi:hypothetical protein
MFLKLIELAENDKFHQIKTICIFNTFLNDLLFISGAFSIFDFRVKKEIKVELNTTLSVLIYFP